MKNLLILLITFLSISIQARITEYEVSSYLSSPSREEVGENDVLTARGNLWTASNRLSTTYRPTPLHKRSLSQAKSLLERDQTYLKNLQSSLYELKNKLSEAGIQILQ